MIRNLVAFAAFLAAVIVAWMSFHVAFNPSGSLMICAVQAGCAFALVAFGFILMESEDD